jgi:peptidoglycan/xylan/chitin deacetylase (PgdA/CDA1 family)
MIIRNFLFHRVSDEPDPLWPPMPPKLFDKIVRHLKAYYSIVGLEEALEGKIDVQAKKRKLASIVFDDGFKDNLQYAAPILKKYAAPASFYVVTDCVENRVPTWTYVVDFLLQSTGKREITFPFEWMGQDRRANFRTYEDVAKYSAKLKLLMKRMSNSQRIKVYNFLKATFDDVEIPDDKMLSWSEVRQLNSAGFSIGSHTATHPLLGKIEDDTELMGELRGSGDTLKENLGSFPKTISYPNGNYTKRVQEAAIKSGYQFGLTVRQQFHDLTSNDLMAITRLELYNEPYLKALLRLKGYISTFRQEVYRRHEG